MEFDQIVKRLDWLDAEERKTKSSITGMEDRLASMERSINVVVEQVKELGKNIAEVASSAARLNQFNELLAKQREDFNRLFEEADDKHQARHAEVVKRHSEEIRPLKDEIDALRLGFDVSPLKRELKARATDQARLFEEISQMKPRFGEIMKAHEEVRSAQVVLVENRRQDIKRVADLQGELTALRKRIEESREKAQLNVDALRNMDNRIHELLALEKERKAAQTAFIEQQSLAQMDRERSIKEWRDKYEEFKQQGQSLDTQILQLDEMLRSAKKAQETYADLNVKLERRISEVSEMQRLSEDRVRQEWVTFKADDQKRWTGYSLAQEEGMRDLRKDMDRLEERMTSLDDAAQVVQDQLQQTAGVTEQQLQEFMNVAHQWLTNYERIMGHAKKATKKAAR
jgi:DNA repair exonuclease SbcCD ATPase subunit